MAGVGADTVDSTLDGPVIDPGLSPRLAGLMEHVLDSEWYAKYAHVPGHWVGGKTGTAQVWDAEHHRWATNLYNFSCVGFIGRREGHPDLIVAVRIQEAHPGRNAQGQLVLPVVSTELFRRVATDAVTTPGLLPVLPAQVPVLARADR